MVSVVPHTGLPQNPGDTPESVDSSRASLQQGNLRIGVHSATLLTLEPPSKSKAPSKRYLLIRLRFEMVGTGADFAGDKWKEIWQGERPRITLTDPLGTAYQSLDAELKPHRAKVASKSQVFPVAATDPLYVFNPPPLDAESLTLEVPTAEYGGTATFRFTIPKSMVRQESRVESKW